MNCCYPTSGVASRQRLRSSSRHHLVIPRHRRSTLGRRAFSVAGQMAWNALPDDLRDPSLSADNFGKGLKTHLFRNALGTLSALEALRNALYKFKTYLLTYLPLTLKVVSTSRLTWDTSVPIFSLPRPLCSRLWPDVCDRRQTCITA